MRLIAQVFRSVIAKAREAKESEYVVGTNGVTAGLVVARIFRTGRWRVYSSSLVRGCNRSDLPPGHSTASGLRTSGFSAKGA